MVSREALGPNPEIPFWKGSDAVVREDAIINANDYKIVPVHIPQGGLPNFLVDRPDLAKDVRAATRSICAQLGLEIDDQASQLEETVKRNPYLVRDSAGLDLSVVVLNHAARDVLIKKDTALFRSFYEKGTQPLMNGELEAAIQNGDIEIDGEFGEDWNWKYENGNRQRKNGVVIKISPKRGWIPKDPNNRLPLVVPENAGREYRSEIDKLLVPVPETPGFRLWIGETQPRVRLSSEVDAVLNAMVLKGMEGRGAISAMGSHTSSHLIDGGSDWHLRVEVLSPTILERMPDYAYLSFFKAA